MPSLKRTTHEIATEGTKESKSRKGFETPKPGTTGLHSIGGRFSGGQKPKNMRETIKRLWRLFGKEQWKLISLFLLATAGSCLGLLGPRLIGLGIDAMSQQADVEFDKLHAILFILGAAYGAGALLSWMQEWWIAGVVQRIIRVIRNALFGHVQSLPLSYIDTHTHGELMSRLSNDVDNVSSMLSSSTTQFFSSLIMVLGAFIMMLVLSPILTLLALLTVPATIIFSGQVAKRSRKQFKEQQANLAELNGHIEEILSGQQVVQSFGHEDNVVAQFDAINQRLYESGRKAQLLSGLVMPMLNALTNIGFVIVATAGGFLAASDIITVGIIASFINYSRQFSRPLNDIANLYSTIQSAQASAERLFELLDEKTEPGDDENAIPVLDPQGHIVFKDVTFGYLKDQPVLKGVSLDAPPGYTVALVGPTGAGKTTIVNLLVRFYDPTIGSIAMDGRDLKDWQRNTLRPCFGMVLQDTYLFSGTIRENLCYGRLTATDGEIEAAAVAVGADPFIKRLPKGYDTYLDEAGGGLSQGQRQLLAIARAVLSEPSVLILDEATSSVDTRTEMVLQKAMLKLRKGRTSFIIAHRLSTIRNADEILYIDHGEIVERGTHQSLIEAKGAYFRQYEGQC